MLFKQFNKITTAVVLAALSQSSFAAGCYACVAPSGGGDGHRTDNRVYAGLEWTLGSKQGFVPQLVVGARSLQVKASDSVSGGDLSVRLNVFGGFGVDSLRLVYVGGNRDVQGNIGGGYSFVDGKFLGTAAVQAAYSRIGADYVFGVGTIRPYVQVNSLQKPKSVNGALSCPSNYKLMSASLVNAAASETTNGQTCSMPVA